MKILGMDLGQGKSAWELLDTNTGAARNGNVGMDEAALRKLLTRLGPDRLVIESGPLAARVHDLAMAGGVAVQVADTTEPRVARHGECCLVVKLNGSRLAASAPQWIKTRIEG